MKFEVVLIMVLGGLSLLIVIANDWWKRRLVRKYESKGKKVPRKWFANKTDWLFLATIAIVLGIYAYLVANPELVKFDLGPLNPIKDWFFREPPKPKY